ncbi:CcmD family protein [Natroniella sp. ANB-PHB2]
MDYFNYLLIGYLIIWVLIFFYTASIGQKQKKLEKEIKFLKDSLD